MGRGLLALAGNAIYDEGWKPSQIVLDGIDYEGWKPSPHGSDSILSLGWMIIADGMRGATFHITMLAISLNL